MSEISKPKQALGMCEDCRFFHAATAYKSEHLDPDVLRGECHRYPPRPVVLNPSSTIDCDTPVGLFYPMLDYRIVHVWPVLNQFDSCGEWASKKRA
jgi:hypothetical protein